MNGFIANCNFSTPLIFCERQELFRFWNLKNKDVGWVSAIQMKHTGCVKSVFKSVSIY